MYTKAAIGKCFCVRSRAGNDEAVIRLALIEQTNSPAFAPRFPWAYTGETWPYCVLGTAIAKLRRLTATRAINYLNAACTDGVQFVRHADGNIFIELSQ